MAPIKQEQRIKPQWFIVKAVALVIFVGALLLLLPWATRSGAYTDPLTALFTATSAVCVTGHTLVDIQQHFTLAGQLVVLILIQAGGLGFIMMGTFLLGVAGRRMSLRNELALMDVMRTDETRNLKSLLRRSLFYSFIFEFCGVVLLAWRFYAVHGQTPLRAVYNGVFHAVSAYCNAGFTLFDDSLTGFRDDPVVLLTVAVLIVAGGLGFMVIYDLSRYKFWSRNRLRRGNLRLHTKIVLISTVLLLVSGAVGFAVFEWHNTLAPMPWHHKLINAFFHSITARTAGFNLVAMSDVSPATLFMNLLLMFIGGSPGSAAGGIKTVTTAVLLATVVSMIRDRREAVLMHRTLSRRNVESALSIFLLATMIVAGVYGLLLITEHSCLTAGVFSADFLLFDTVSAFGTVGLTTGIMPALSTFGRMLIIISMFIGRVGPLTIAMVISMKSVGKPVRHPEEAVMLG